MALIAFSSVLMSKQQDILNGENNLILKGTNLPKGLLFITIKEMENNQSPIVFKLIKD
jgi:hypothetical protein